MSVCFVKRKFAAWSLALTLAVLASLLITSFVFAESEDLPAVPEENEPAAAESGGTAEAPAVEAPGEAQPADESGGETEPPQDEGESGGETEPPQDEGEAEVEIEPPQEEVAEPVTETIPAEDTEAVVNPVEEPCQENVVPQVETPVEELETTLLEPAEAEEATNGIVDAAQLTGGGDPYWYVGTKKYAVVTNISLCPADAYQCWVSTTPIQKALDKIEDESLLPTDKKLYVLAGIYTEDISFEGELLSKMNGLIGVDGSTTTIINGDIYIPFNTGGFTLSGFTINGGVEVTDSTGNLVFSDLVVTNTNGDGIHVTGGTDEEYDEWPHPGTVTLDHVNSSNNQGAGAYIQSKNTIIVTNSTFDNNDNRDFDFPDQRAGLYLQNNWYPGGFKVELYNVIANQNYGNGITIKTGNAVIQNVTANGNKSYSDSWDNIIGGDGLFVYATNSLNMNNITAFSNEDEGVYADSKVVTIKNFIANDNEGSGVSTYSWQKINVENVTANDNGAFGVVAYGYGGINAAITIKNIIANGNGYSGIIVQNQNGGAVTITNTTTNGNTQVGVFIISGGTVKLTTIRSSNNSQHGLFVEGYERWKDNGYWDEEDNWVEDWVFLGLASPLVTLASPADANFVNVFNNNGGLGIYIRSDKPVVITNFKANNNASSGLEVEGMCKWDEDAGSYVDCHPSGALTIKSTITGFNNTLDGNGYIGIEVADANGAVIIERTQVTNGHNMGIYINTLGAITLKDVKSNTNRESGLVLLNNQWC
jgi:putative surface-exposed virulence protein